jgi:hypothetical protein
MLGWSPDRGGPTSFLGLDSRPDWGCPTLYGWWAPVALRNIKRWEAGGSVHKVHRSHFLLPTTPNFIERGRNQWREAPLDCAATPLPPLLHRELHCIGFPFFNHRCSWAELHRRTRWQASGLAPTPPPLPRMVCTRRLSSSFLCFPSASSLPLFSLYRFCTRTPVHTWNVKLFPRSTGTWS